MSFLYAAALAVALFAVGPFVAHLLRRRSARVQPFAPTHLVPKSQQVTQERHRLDDRALFAVRLLSIRALAALGATPFVTCAGLSLARNDGASVAFALVLDDSLSMQATLEDGTTRWDRARKAALDLAKDAREGDAVAIVLAGAPARVALASTTDLSAARSVLEALPPSHRATDLDGALSLARALLRGMPQPDRRIVLLSDLSDGSSAAAPLGGAGEEVPIWAPLAELAQPVANCAVLRADRVRDHVAVHLACSSEEAAAGREVELRAGDQVLAKAPLAPAGDVVLRAEGAPSSLVVALTGGDAIEVDDRAPVLESSSALGIGVVADPASSRAPTGGPPLLEQALSALSLDAEIRPLPLMPDRVRELAPYGALVIDDPAGFTPEARRALTAFLERGGVALVMLGPRAQMAPLGSSFEPLLSGAVTVAPSPVRGLETDAAHALFGTAAEGLSDLAPRRRPLIDAKAVIEPAKVALRWEDGAPWLVEKPMGRGLAYVLGLPASPDESDLPLRPAFLSLLERVVDAARARTGASRTEVGHPWAFEGVRALAAKGPTEAPLVAVEEANRTVLTPELLGSYEVLLDGEKLLRIAAPSEKEITARPREVAETARSSSLGEVRAKIDVSPWVATLLLGLMVLELGLRLWSFEKEPKGT